MLPRRHRNTRVVEDHTVAQSARVLETRYQRLAADVKKLTNEVSRLTERREKLQLEIADLMRLKAEHTVDTAVIHDSKTQGPNLGASRPDPSTPSTSAFHDQPRKSAWRPVVPHQRALDRYKGKPPPSSGTVSKRSKLSARPPLVSWASWMPNAIFMPTPPVPQTPLPSLPKPQPTSQGILGTLSLRSNGKRVSSKDGR